MPADHPKQTCAAFGCKRWSRQFPAGWSFLCRDHYQMVPRKYRRLHKRLMRQYNKTGDKALLARESRAWARCIRKANDAQFGIG